jgi:hypothetical protein
MGAPRWLGATVGGRTGTRLSLVYEMSRLGRRTFLVVIPLLAALAVVISRGGLLAHANPIHVKWRPEAHPQTNWVKCNRNAHSTAPSTFKPLSDSAAAALVTPEPETRPYNAKPYSIDGKSYPATNSYVPTAAQIKKFLSAKDSNGEPVLKLNPYLRYVDGRDGLSHPSTDDLIQWSAHKWGIPENWLRAEFVLESYWNSFMLGDETAVSAADYKKYPVQSRVPGTLEAYQSLGITQVRWDPQGDYGAGTNPVRWLSTAFNLDEQGAMVRFFYDNPAGSRTQWGDKTYEPCQAWNSIGGWFSPYPWANAGQAHYIASVKTNLETTVWKSQKFLSFKLPLPPGVKLR